MSEPSESNDKSPRRPPRQIVWAIALAAGTLLVCLLLTAWFMWPRGADVAGQVAPGGKGPGEGSATTTAVEPTRLAVPDSGAQHRALAELAGTWQGKSAAEVLAAAQSSSLTPAARYALLGQAERTAMVAGRVEDALGVIDRKAAEFEVDALAAKVSALQDMRDNLEQPEMLRNVARACLALIDNSEPNGSRLTAERLAIIALTAARRAEDQTQVTLATYWILKLREQ